MIQFLCRFAFLSTVCLLNRTPKIARILTLYQANATTLTPLSKEDLLTQEDKPQSQEKLHLRRGIHRSSVSQIIHKVLRLKCYKKRRAQQLTEAHSMHALFSACSLRDDNLITSKPT